LIEETDANNSLTEVSSFEELESKMTDKELLKLKFARKLAVAVSENQEMRSFLKREALEMINNDYDVFYPVVKDKSIKGSDLKSSADPSSFRNVLLQYFDSESELIEIEQQLPLLTIFVPALPENSFSAQNWNTVDVTQNPVVAVRLSTSNDVPMIDNTHDHEYVLESDLIPAYPVIVVKDNERIQLNNGNSINSQKNSNPCHTNSLIAANPSFSYIDNNFDPCVTYSGGGSNGGASNHTPCDPRFPSVPGRDTTVDQYLTDAYNVFNGAITNPWHRDNIYYQLTPSQTEGAFVGGRFAEAVTYFQLAGHAPSLFSTMSDQTAATGDNDPVNANHNWDHDQRNRTPWTDGFFEMEVIVIDNSKTRNLVSTPRLFSARPEQLFEYGQETVVRQRGAWPITWQRTYWRPIITGFKGMDLMSNELGSQNVRINPWDLQNYSNNWTYKFSEIDNTVEVTDVTTASRKYNQNFEYNASLDDVVKVGLKYGASLEESITNSRSSKFTEGSDRIGEFDVAFYDRMLNLNPCDGKLYPRLYSTSQLQVEIRPVQVEF